MSLLSAMFPETLLITVACVLFLLGVSSRAFARRVAAEMSLVSLAILFVVELFKTAHVVEQNWDAGYAVHVTNLSHYVNLITTGTGMLLVLLNWPTNRDATGNGSLETGNDTSEFFGLLLLSLAGLCTVGTANDLILLFLGIELASIPTYVMVSISRPLPVAQEAGLKYFYLGAMSAAVMLFGFSYLYGVTGTTSLMTIADQMAHSVQTPWHVLAILLLLGGFAFKMAAVPLHVYAGDVYQGAATPVTALLSFVPKTSGFIALLKVLFAFGGTAWHVPEPVFKALWAVAALTMTFGNVLALLQYNLKRTLAYSSVAHTGYMLVGVTALVHSDNPDAHVRALTGILFYLGAYGVMNVAAFGVLQLIPSRVDRPATTAETFEDISGQGRKHLGLGLAMAVACFSLTGIPPAVGFFGKMMLATPAGAADLWGLSLFLWVNSAVSAVYYLRIVTAMFLRPEPTHLTPVVRAAAGPTPAAPVIAILASVIFTLLVGGFLPTTNVLARRAERAATFDMPPTPPATFTVPPTVAALK